MVEQHNHILNMKILLLFKYLYTFQLLAQMNWNLKFEFFFYKNMVKTLLNNLIIKRVKFWIEYVHLALDNSP